MISFYCCHMKLCLVNFSNRLSFGLDICNKPLVFFSSLKAFFRLRQCYKIAVKSTSPTCLVNMPTVQKDSYYLIEGVSPRAVETWPWSVSIILSSEYNCMGVLNWACTIFTPGSSISKGMLGAILAATFKSPGQIVLRVLTEDGVLRPLPPSTPDGVLHPLC